ncbi:hypothetical protein [uncultured Flavobacterium sp.]|uniref:hypothetical protein n=1 Tax=uncultured Flavobacterium sp. TaxID=165435 RepID=UPI0025E27A06|nr:hypothetical protein [uncultured Flavobacterium sp.]
MKSITKIVTILILFSNAIGYSQESENIYKFVVINDPKDSTVNLRNESNTKSYINERLANGTTMFAFEKENGWVYVECHEDEYKAGYVHESRVKLITSFTEVKPTLKEKNSTTFKNKDVLVRITKQDFVKSEHDYVFENESKYSLETIDDKKPWGTDGIIPHNEYKNISVKISGNTISLPKKYYRDLYEPNLNLTSIYYDEINDTLYIIANNSDGAGAYAMLLTIKHKKFKKRTLVTPF